MIKRLRQSLLERARKEFWSLSPASSLYFLIVLFLPTQFGRHFWPDFSFVSGLRVDYLSPTLYVTDILTILLFIFWCLPNLKKIITLKISPPFFLVALSIFLLAGIFISNSRPAGMYGILKLAEFSFLGFYTARNISNLRQIVYALSIGLSFESILAIAQYFNQSSLNSIFYFVGERTFNSQTPGIANASLNGSLVLRPYATFSHPNVLAAYMVLSMTLILFYIRNKFKYPLLLLGTIALFLTLSRVAIVVWIFALCLYFFRKRWKEAALAGIVISSLIYFSPLGNRFLSLAGESVSQRLSLISAATAMFTKNPILGVGINNFLPNLPFYIKQTGNTFFLQPVHNIFLLVLSETGVIGFGFFLWFLFKTYKRILRKKSILALVLISEVLFLGFFDHYFLTLQQGQLMFALILGICWSNLEG